jgi:Fic family protein
MKKFKIIKSNYLDVYKKKQPITLLKHFNKIKGISQSSENFNFYLSKSAVYSSMIEGNIIDFDSYLQYTESGMGNKGKSFIEIEELKSAYSFARTNKLSLNSFLSAHKILSKSLIPEAKYRGKIRDRNVSVYENDIKVYTGTKPEFVEQEIKQFFNEISVLLESELTITEVFYFASMIHLSFVMIHPFSDGNGRSSRLLEKWFLAEKLGKNAWFIQSEKLYQNRLRSYYKNVNLGADYESIDFDYSLPFLLMLPMALRLS